MTIFCGFDTQAFSHCLKIATDTELHLGVEVNPKLPHHVSAVGRTAVTKRPMLDERGNEML